MTLLVSDNFDRANANPIGGIYAVPATMNAVQIVSNVAEGTVAGANCGAIDTSHVYISDQFSSVTVQAIGGGGSFYAMVRATAGVQSFAYLYFSDNTSWLFNIYKAGTNVVNNFSVTSTRAAQAGDVITVSVTGQVYSFFQNNVLIGTYTDGASNLTAGQPGFVIFPTATLTQNQVALFQAGSNLPANVLQLASNDNGSANSSPVTATLPVATTAGSLITVHILLKTNAGGAISGVSDSASQSYSSAVTPVSDGNHYKGALYYFANSVSGVTTVTVSMSTPQPCSFIVVEEAQVLTSSPLDGTPIGAGQVTASFNSGLLTTTNAVDVLYGFCGTELVSTVTPAIPWISLTTHTNGPDTTTVFVGRQTVMATGNYQATGALSLSTNVVSIVSAFKQNITLSSSNEMLMGVG